MKGVNTGVGEDVAVGRFTVSRLVSKLEAKSVSTSVREKKGDEQMPYERRQNWDFIQRPTQ